MHGRHVMDPLTWAISNRIIISTWLNSRLLLFEPAVSQVLFELLLLETIEQRVLLEPICEVVQHYHFVANSSELDCVTNS